MNFVDLPPTVDPDSRMWGGAQPLNLRVELVDAKNHWYTIDKAVRRQIAQRLARFQQMHKLLEGVEEIIRPAGIGQGHGCHLYVARLDTDKVTFTRADFLKHLKEVWQVATANHYPAVWSWEAFAKVPYDNSDTPVTHKAVEQVMSLPLFPSSTEEEVEYLALAIKETIAALRR